MRAKLLLRSTACIIQTNVPSAAPRLGMLRNLHRLLAPPSAHTIYYHRTRARVINYWHQGRQRATSVPPSNPRRKNEENRSRTARGYHVVPVGICAKQTGLLEKCDKWALNNSGANRWPCRPCLVRGLHVVLKPCNPKRSSPFTETRQPGRAAGPTCLPEPFIDGR
jgi:hypothetical protein